jgi:Fic family protein
MITDKYQLTLEENIFLAKRNIVDSIYKESRLEGIAITFPETNEIYEGRAVAGMSVDDIVKVNNLKHAWQFMLDTVEYPIDLRYIRQLSQIIGDKIVPLAGELRVSDVNIGGTTWKPEIPDMDRISEKIEGIMQQEISTTEKAIELMLFLMRGQIFYDGNKRVAQLAANQVMIQNGKGIISIPVEHQKQFFIMLVKYYETNQMDEIKEFVYENAISGINFEKKQDKKPLSKDEFYRKKVKSIEPKL